MEMMKGSSGDFGEFACSSACACVFACVLLPWQKGRGAFLRLCMRATPLAKG